VHANDLVTDEGRGREAIEDVAKSLPQIDAIAPLALVVEAVDPANRRRLVVPPEKEKVLWILDLVCEEEADCLKTPLTTVNVVSQEKIIGLRRKPPVVEDSEQIVVLPVHISTKLEGSLQFQEHGLIDKDVPRSCAKMLYLFRIKMYVLASWVPLSHRQKLVQYVVNVELDPICLLLLHWRRAGHGIIAVHCCGGSVPKGSSANAS